MKKLVVILFILCTVFFLFGCEQDLSALVNGYVSSNNSSEITSATPAISSSTETSSILPKQSKEQSYDSLPTPAASTGTISPDIEYETERELKVLKTYFSTSYDYRKAGFGSSIIDQDELNNLLSTLDENEKLYQNLVEISNEYPLKNYTVIRVSSSETRGGTSVTLNKVTIKNDKTLIVDYTKTEPQIGTMVMCSWDLIIVTKKVDCEIESVMTKGFFYIDELEPIN